MDFRDVGAKVTPRVSAEEKAEIFSDTPLLSTGTLRQGALASGVGAGVGYAQSGLSGVFVGAELGLAAYAGYKLYEEYDYWFGEGGSSTAPADKIIDSTEKWADQWLKTLSGDEKLTVEKVLGWIASNKGISINWSPVNKSIFAFVDQYHKSYDDVADDFLNWRAVNHPDSSITSMNPDPKQFAKWILYEDRKLSATTAVRLVPITPGTFADLQRVNTIALRLWRVGHPDRKKKQWVDAIKSKDFEPILKGVLEAWNRATTKEKQKEFFDSYESLLALGGE